MKKVCHILLNKFYTYAGMGVKFDHSNLWDVNTTEIPDDFKAINKFQIWRRDTGSIPAVGSSRKTNGGNPTIAIAILSFLLFPPLKSIHNHPNVITHTNLMHTKSLYVEKEWTLLIKV